VLRRNCMNCRVRLTEDSNNVGRFAPNPHFELRVDSHDTRAIAPTGLVQTALQLRLDVRSRAGRSGEVDIEDHESVPIGSLKLAKESMPALEDARIALGVYEHIEGDRPQAHGGATIYQQSIEHDLLVTIGH